jgi:hypothetical protein
MKAEEVKSQHGERKETGKIICDTRNSNDKRNSE